MYMKLDKHADRVHIFHDDTIRNFPILITSIKIMKVLLPFGSNWGFCCRSYIFLLEF